MLSRRRFVLRSGLALGSLALPHPLRASGIRGVTKAQRQWLLAVLPKEDQRYDPFAKMLVTSAASSPGYHTTLKSGDVHATRPSLTYAAALLDAGEKWRVERAKEILRVVLSLQDQDSTSKTYGLWPWYLEEPQAKMSPPDWNWADFCAVPLLMAWLGHREELGTTLANDTRDAIVHAAHCIERRNVGPGYTNIAIMGTGVTLLAAQEFKLADLRAYAKERLRKLHDYVIRQGSFTEYNSPTYTVIALQELARMLWLVKDARDRSLISALHDLAWKHAATHFHPPTQQWAGPHSRSYEADLRKRPATLAFLQTACGGRANFHLPDPLPLSLEAYRLPLQCPRQWVKQFTTLDAPRAVVETFVKADPSKPGSINSIVGTTWLHPRLALGSVNRGDFWRQRRPLVAYWGTPSAPRYLQLRLLKNDTDFASALIFTVQHQGAVLSVVTFATDHGDTHPSLDKVKDATIKATDLRLRFEFGGERSALTVKAVAGADRHYVIQDRDARFILRPISDSFGGAPIRWDSPELKLTDRIDAVIHQGAEKSFNLAGLGEAFICFTLEEWPYEERRMPGANVMKQHALGRLRARWVTRGKTLDLDVPIKPGPYAALNDSFRSLLV